MITENQSKAVSADQESQLKLLKTTTSVLAKEPIYPDHRIRPQKLRQNSSSHWQVLTSQAIGRS